VKTPFYGGYGAIAAGGIPKAAFHAFALLHRLGDRRLANGSDSVLVTKRADGSLVVALWNYAEPGKSAPEKEFQLTFSGLRGGARYRAEVLDDQHGSAVEAWRAAGAPINPTPAQVKQMRLAKTSVSEGQIAGPLTLRLAAHGLAVIEISGNGAK
jgi:xylan 1,4-beta-xylosidase